ncbi:Imm63 family immunity protein [Bartonella sp. HY038]|uniref:Imm63 family immunity protein n=1 Tax=Bartonella sp. HY038 TaxID=2759660 RepID=UPI0015FB03A0|nr:Imm63 family immunity protein [Bartonella sp. HY038]
MVEVKDKIAKIRDAVNDILIAHNLPKLYYDTVPEAPQGDGTPYLTYAGDVFTILYEERGKECGRIENLSFDEVIRFYIFESVIQFGRDYEQNNRQDGSCHSRWNWMKPTIEVMAQVSEDYGKYAYDHYIRFLRHSRLTKDEVANSWFDIPKVLLRH